MRGVPEKSFSILIVDDEMVIRDVLEDFLSSEGFDVVSVSSGHEALEELDEEPYDALLSDLMMPGMTGLQLIEEVKKRGHQVVPIIMTGYGTIETAVHAMKIGAYDYILKPFKMEEVLQVLNRSFERQQLQRENIDLKHTVNIYRISETIASTKNVSEILKEILNASLEETGADYVRLQTYEEFAVPDLCMERLAENGECGPFELNMEPLCEALGSQGSLLLRGEETAPFVQQDSPSLHSSLIATPLRISNVTLGIIVALSLSKRTRFSEGHRKFLSILATKAAASLENFRLIDKLKEANRELTEANRAIQENFRQTILGFARAIEQNDPYTRGHSDRVAKYSRLIAKTMGLGEPFVEDITFAGQLHDIGKIGISPQKLNKAGKLNAPEIRMFRRHPEMGKRILEPISFMRHLIPGVYCHHEKYDGTGYPQGLKREEIPLMGRIIAVADTYDAMTSDRSYRKALSEDVAVEELRRNSGTQFDPQVVTAFLDALTKRNTV